ncbi:Isochorismatase hydrolase [Daldinia caldariorum]|uniref:Isochorismatase hydrolase n=1 Tax=Daldinia caldariorum TaxID=326644 RepID=UPI00200809C3|nr:Isochorismatase hydrolase [Daldinia caldariorum]KAI1467001.1 Isochorismatase hydrolase [Daldinia caldariorum]
MNLARTSRFTLAKGLRRQPFVFSPPLYPSPSPYPVTCQAGPKKYARFSTTMADIPQRRLQRPVVLVCDMQEKFRSAILMFDLILRTTQKVLRAAKILDVPVIVTTQNAAKLGPTVSELQELTENAVINADKTAFSMLRVPEVAARFPRVVVDPARETAAAAAEPPSEVAIVGIEAHICVTQTALDLLARGHKVYVLADGVSSCNRMDARAALARLRAEGAVVTTSESWIYECMGDAGIPEFREVARLVKETGPGMKEVLRGLESNL